MSAVAAVKAGPIQEVADWTGKKFGELRGFRTVAHNIRILVHEGGFAIFLPKEVWRPLDVQVELSFPEKKNSACWIAERDFAFVKVDVTPSQLQGSDAEYASADVDVALRKVESFVERNFFRNEQARPDSGYFTWGSYTDQPDMPRPIRFRMGGNFHFQF